MSGANFPFDSYLNAPHAPIDYNARDNVLDIQSPSPYSSIQFQLPHFVLPGPPLLAPGGGAEVLSPFLYAGQDQTFSSSWFNNSAVSETLKLHLDDTKNPHYQRRTPLTQPPPISIPSPHGLPVYSASGFDILPILARVSTRPNPKIVLGPVDCTCSFVVVDIRRYDSPIVYASPNFCVLTGYSENEVLGRNCRFLQNPYGTRREDVLDYPSREAVALLKNALAGNKECQYSLLNYRKDGSSFVNFLTVIPVPATDAPEHADDIAYHVGFQVDLTEQPNAIVEKVRDGTYNHDHYSPRPIPWQTPAALNSSARSRTSPVMSANLRKLLADPAFQRSILPSTTTTPSVCPDKSDLSVEQQTLNHFLLEHGPDFIHVLSLKGTFLYVSPSVRDVLGYEADELCNTSVTDYCHPHDVVPLTRELKDSSAAPTGMSGAQSAPGQPKTVNLLFRARSKSGTYVWLECTGRLHLEPGKSRKAIVLSARARAEPYLAWDAVARAGGLAPPLPASLRSVIPSADAEDELAEQEGEFWGMLSREGTFLVAGAGVRSVLGWGAGEMIGRSIGEFINGDSPAAGPSVPLDMGDVRRDSTAQQRLRDALARVSKDAHKDIKIPCEMTRRDGAVVSVHITVFRPQDGLSSIHGDGSPIPRSPTFDCSPETPVAPVVCQFKIVQPGAFCTSTSTHSGRIDHPHSSNLFEELEMDHSSSWQYELQQLKFDNRKLMDEVDLLEAAIPHQQPQQIGQINSQGFSSQSSTSSFQPPQQLAMAQGQAQTNRSRNVSQNLGGAQNHDNSSLYYQNPLLGKRNWELGDD